MWLQCHRGDYSQLGCPVLFLHAGSRLGCAFRPLGNASPKQFLGVGCQATCLDSSPSFSPDPSSGTCRYWGDYDSGWITGLVEITHWQSGFGKGAIYFPFLLSRQAGFNVYSFLISWWSLIFLGGKCQWREAWRSLNIGSES